MITALNGSTTLLPLARYMCFLRGNYSISAQFQEEISPSPKQGHVRGDAVLHGLIYDNHVMCSLE